MRDPTTRFAGTRTLPTMTPLPGLPIVPTHPGPEPVEPVFPTTEANAALEAIDGLLDGLMGLETTRNAAVTEMVDHASGLSIDTFNTRNDELSTTLHNTWASRGSALQMDAEWLRQAILDAQTRHDTWVEEHAAWSAAMERYEASLHALVQ